MTSAEPALEPSRQQKSPSAFRTISEVSTALDVPQHVLRFWETKFTQLRPLKRGGGRRYYRPEDVQLLFRIRELLYRDGYTIKGVQRLFRTEGIRGLDGGESLHPAMAEAMEPESEPMRREPPGLSEPLGEPLNKRAELESVLRDLLEIRGLLRDPSEPS